MRSQVNWALLGLVIRRSSYAYELVHRFERSYGNSIELSSPSQVYVALDTLESKGLIRKVQRTPDAPGSRQPKPHYRVTPEGVLCFQEWLVAQAEQERTRSRLFTVQLAMLPADRALAVLDRYESACLEAASDRPAGRETRTLGLAERLTLEDDRVTLEARLAWIQYARLQFSSKPKRRPEQ